MALDKSKIVDGLRAMSDTSYSNFQGFPTSIEDSAERYRLILKDYIEDMTPFTSGAYQASIAFKNIYMQMSSESQNGIVILTSALTTFTTIIAATIPGYIGTPPPVQIVLGDLPILGTVDQLSSEQISQIIGDRTHTWIKTGVAVINGGGTPILWS